MAHPEWLPPYTWRSCSAPKLKDDPLEELGVEQRSKLLGLQRQLEREPGHWNAKQHDLYLLRRFLKARNWDPAAAHQMWTDMLAFRASHKVDSILSDFHFHERAAFVAAYPHGLHKVDRMGRPVLVYKLGAVDLEALKSVTSDSRMTLAHIQDYERINRCVLPACSLMAGRHVEQVTTLIDVAGLRMKDMMRVKDLLASYIKVDSNNYPETLGAMVIINAPYWFSGMFAAVKAFLPTETQKKVQILGSSYQQALLQLISPDNLLTEFGGHSHGSLADNLGPWTATLERMRAMALEAEEALVRAQSLARAKKEEEQAAAAAAVKAAAAAKAAEGAVPMEVEEEEEEGASEGTVVVMESSSQDEEEEEEEDVTEMETETEQEGSRSRQAVGRAGTQLEGYSADVESSSHGGTGQGSTTSGQHRPSFEQRSHRRVSMEAGGAAVGTAASGFSSYTSSGGRASLEASAHKHPRTSLEQRHGPHGSPHQPMDQLQQQQQQPLLQHHAAFVQHRPRAGRGHSRRSREGPLSPHGQHHLPSAAALAHRAASMQHEPVDIELHDLHHPSLPPPPPLPQGHGAAYQLHLQQHPQQQLQGGYHPQGGYYRQEYGQQGPPFPAGMYAQLPPEQLPPPTRAPGHGGPLSPRSPPAAPHALEVSGASYLPPAYNPQVVGSPYSPAQASARSRPGTTGPQAGIPEHGWEAPGVPALGPGGGSPYSPAAGGTAAAGQLEQHPSIAQPHGFAHVHAPGQAGAYPGGSQQAQAPWLAPAAAGAMAALYGGVTSPTPQVFSPANANTAGAPAASNIETFYSAHTEQTAWVGSPSDATSAAAPGAHPASAGASPHIPHMSYAAALASGGPKQQQQHGAHLKTPGSHLQGVPEAGQGAAPHASTPTGASWGSNAQGVPAAAGGTGAAGQAGPLGAEALPGSDLSHAAAAEAGSLSPRPTSAHRSSMPGSSPIGVPSPSLATVPAQLALLAAQAGGLLERAEQEGMVGGLSDPSSPTGPASPVAVAAGMAGAAGKKALLEGGAPGHARKPSAGSRPDLQAQRDVGSQGGLSQGQISPQGVSGGGRISLDVPFSEAGSEAGGSQSGQPQPQSRTANLRNQLRAAAAASSTILQHVAPRLGLGRWFAARPAAATAPAADAGAAAGADAAAGAGAGHAEDAHEAEHMVSPRSMSRDGHGEDEHGSPDSGVTAVSHAASCSEAGGDVRSGRTSRELTARSVERVHGRASMDSAGAAGADRRASVGSAAAAAAASGTRKGGPLAGETLMEVDEQGVMHLAEGQGPLSRPSSRETKLGDAGAAGAASAAAGAAQGRAFVDGLGQAGAGAPAQDGMFLLQPEPGALAGSTTGAASAVPTELLSFHSCRSGEMGSQVLSPASSAGMPSSTGAARRGGTGQGSSGGGAPPAQQQPQLLAAAGAGKGGHHGPHRHRWGPPAAQKQLQPSESEDAPLLHGQQQVPGSSQGGSSDVGPSSGAAMAGARGHARLSHWLGQGNGYAALPEDGVLSSGSATAAGPGKAGGLPLPEKDWDWGDPYPSLSDQGSAPGGARQYNGHGQGLGRLQVPPPPEYTAPQPQLMGAGGLPPPPPPPPPHLAGGAASRGGGTSTGGRLWPHAHDESSTQQLLPNRGMSQSPILPMHLHGHEVEMETALPGAGGPLNYTVLDGSPLLAGQQNSSSNPHHPHHHHHQQHNHHGLGYTAMRSLLALAGRGGKSASRQQLLDYHGEDNIGNDAAGGGGGGANGLGSSGSGEVPEFSHMLPPLPSGHHHHHHHRSSSKLAYEPSDAAPPVALARMADGPLGMGAGASAASHVAGRGAGRGRHSRNPSAGRGGGRDGGGVGTLVVAGPAGAAALLSAAGIDMAQALAGSSANEEDATAVGGAAAKPTITTATPRHSRNPSLGAPLGASRSLPQISHEVYVDSEDEEEVGSLLGGGAQRRKGSVVVDMLKAFCCC